MTAHGTATLELVRRHHPNCNLGDLYHPTKTQWEHRTCVIDLSQSAAVTLTYGMFEERVCRAVNALRLAQIGRGARMALALPNSATFLVAFLALMRRGAIPVLLNHQLGVDAVRFMLVDSGSVGIIADLEQTPRVTRLVEGVDLRLRIAVRGLAPGWSDWHELNQVAPDASVEAMAHEDQAFQPYTAGSTGTPKGIILTHGGMLWGVEHSQAHWPVADGMRGIVAAPMFHKNAIRGTVKPMLRGGGSFVIMPSFNARSYLDAVARYEVTNCGGVPSMFSAMLEETATLVAGDYRRLKTMVLGSSIVPRELLQRLRRTFPTTQVKESYGLTEGGPSLGPPEGGPTPLGSVGTVLPEVEAKLVNEAGEDSGDGELWLRSPYIFRGYAGQPKLTAEKLTDGWLHTGDRFHRDADGFYFFVGRMDDMFICGGENLYPKQVEDLILRHFAVRDVVVVPLAHATKGFAPAAMVALRDGSAVTPTELQDFCAANGPKFAIPRAILMADGLPLSPAGKPDRKAVSNLMSTTFGTLRSRGTAGS